MRNKKDILIVVLSAIIVVGMVVYVGQSRQKGRLLRSLQKVKGQLAILEADNRRLMIELENERKLSRQLAQDRASLGQAVKERDEKLAALSDVQNTIDALNAQILALRSETQSLKEETLRLKLELAQGRKSSEASRGRRDSVAELKKAIKELKKQVTVVKRQIRNNSSDVALTGNRGFIIRGGKSTYPARVRIEVNPAQ
ncbi:MAG: hypothetical protein WC469_04260 [Candidatus Omnitrophota bacterium]|jgi:chromosome segregation ATPase